MLYIGLDHSGSQPFVIESTKHAVYLCRAIIENTLSVLHTYAAHLEVKFKVLPVICGSAARLYTFTYTLKRRKRQ